MVSSKGSTATSNRNQNNQNINNHWEDVKPSMNSSSKAGNSERASSTSKTKAACQGNKAEVKFITLILFHRLILESKDNSH